MKKAIIFFTAIAFTIVCNAQWKVKTEGNGFDEKYYVASVLSKDGEAKINMILHEGKVVLDVETPEIVYRERYSTVEVTFKIKGENKMYEIGGSARSGSSLLLLTPKGGGPNDIGDLFTEEILNDFKNASLMKMKIIYTRPYLGSSISEYEEYVFNMSGSSNAYNRVLKQK